MSSSKEIFTQAEERMKKSLEALHNNLGKLRTGRANIGLLDPVRVSYYGSETPLSQVASITITDARTLTVTPWEKGMMQAIEKAIIAANLGLNPSSVGGQSIRVPLPPLTEERRKDLIKIMRSEGEDARVSVRNARRDANNHLKDLLKEKMISEDEEHRSQDNIQKLTDKFIADIDKTLSNKEADLMEF